MQSQWRVRQFRPRCPTPSPSSCWCGCTLRGDGVGRIRCRTRPRPPEGDGRLFWPSTDHRCPSAGSKDFFKAGAGKVARGRISPDRRLCLRSRGRRIAKSRRSTTRPSSLLGTTDRIPCCPESARPLWAAYSTWNLQKLRQFAFLSPQIGRRRRVPDPWVLPHPATVACIPVNVSGPGLGKQAGCTKSLHSTSCCRCTRAMSLCVPVAEYEGCTTTRLTGMTRFRLVTSNRASYSATATKNSDAGLLKLISNLSIR